MKQLICFSAFLFGAQCIVAQPVPAPMKPLPLDPLVRQGVLPNGMKYYIEHNAKPEKRAELRLAVNAGSTMENDDQQGLAHFVEHMAFNGSKNFKKNDLVNFLESIGTKFGPDLNAYTSFDETVYMLQIPTDKKDVYEKGFTILEDWAHNLSFDSAEVEKERGVVMEEWRLGQGAFERMSRKYWPVLFKDSRYAERFPIGKPDILKNCKQQVLRDFYHDWYRPDLQAIVVVGDVDVNATEQLIKERFSAIPSLKNERPIKSWEVPDQKDLRISVVSDLESPYNILQLDYMAAAQKHVTLSDYETELKARLINGMISDRLTEITRKPGAPFIYGGAAYTSNVRTKDAYNSFLIFKNGQAAQALQSIVTENERIRRFGFTATELDRQKKQILTQSEKRFNERDKTESKSIVGSLVYLFLDDRAVPGIVNEHRYIQTLLPTITLDDINTMVKQWIRPDGENAVIIAMMAEKEGNPIPKESEVKDWFTKAEADQSINAYEDKVVNGPLVPKAPIPQKVTKTEDKTHGITEWTLGNGAHIVLKPTDFKADEIQLSAHSWGGSSLYADRDYFSADNSNAVQEQMGFGAFDQTALEKYLQDKNASLSTSVTDYEEGLTGRSGKRDLKTLLELVYAYFTMPRKDSTAFQSYIQTQRGFVQNMSSDPRTVFGDSVRYIMSGYNMRSQPNSDATISQISLARSYEIYKERFADPSDFVFTFVGSFTLDSIKPLIETYIGGISVPQHHETAKDLHIKAPEGTLARTFKKGAEPRSSVQLMWTGEVKYDRRNRFDMRALSMLLNITLRENLREDKGGVYGVGMSPQIQGFPHGSYKFVCSFACAPDNVQKLIDAAKDEVNKARTSPCSETNLTKIKETMLKERETQLKENSFWLSYIYATETYHESYADLDVYTKWVNELKAEDLKRFANTYLNDKALKTFILNPEK